MNHPSDPAPLAWPERFELTVNGIPAPQGSKRHIGGGRMIEMSKKLPAWRKVVIEAAQAEAGPEWEAMTPPLRASLHVLLPRPKKSKHRGPWSPPDLDKLQRAIGDALEQAGVIVDDAGIVEWHARKDWTFEDGQPGAFISVERIPNRVEPFIHHHQTHENTPRSDQNADND
ncbi:RusA family crossover junction endodeoxyribonuclease [Brevibacterium otitidis]|uniref:RusA family crossover junction endodeoxyribonuclease n=1 Tax=Brevibacterium otitidis TaxID=53364 RepID=A0ABV5X4E0_9MICO|nr:hypothetical protein GCM10023233_22890 [Brevibacterium otitidis]